MFDSFDIQNSFRSFLNNADPANFICRICPTKLKRDPVFCDPSAAFPLPNQRNEKSFRNLK